MPENTSKKSEAKEEQESVSEEESKVFALLKDRWTIGSEEREMEETAGESLAFDWISRTWPHDSEDESPLSSDKVTEESHSEEHEEVESKASAILSKTWSKGSDNPEMEEKSGDSLAFDWISRTWPNDSEDESPLSGDRVTEESHSEEHEEVESKASAVFGKTWSKGSDDPEMEEKSGESLAFAWFSRTISRDSKDSDFSTTSSDEEETPEEEIPKEADDYLMRQEFVNNILDRFEAVGTAHNIRKQVSQLADQAKDFDDLKAIVLQILDEAINEINPKPYLGLHETSKGIARDHLTAIKDEIEQNRGVVLRPRIGSGERGA